MQFLQKAVPTPSLDLLGYFFFTLRSKLIHPLEDFKHLNTSFISWAVLTMLKLNAIFIKLQFQVWPQNIQYLSIKT